MFDIQPLFDLSFWFDLTPNFLSPAFVQGFFILFAVCIILGAVIRIMSRSLKKNRDVYMVRMRIGSMFITMGFIGLFWLFFAYEGIQYVGARFWFLLWILGFIFWAYMIRRFVKVELPKRNEARAKKGTQNKYLPRRSR